MNNAADIRKENKRAIYSRMLDGGVYTKQQISQATGLSVATCNTLLNDMAAQGFVCAVSKQAGDVGRSAALYRIASEHEQYLTLYFELEDQIRLIETAVFSASGEILDRQTRRFGQISRETVTGAVRTCLEKFPNLAQIIVGIPGVVERGIIRHCDIRELENLHLQEELESDFALPVAMENDMHHKAYGYYKNTGNREDVITLGYFPKGNPPGTVTIHKGTILRGTSGIAGMAGFLPHGGKNLQEILTPENCLPFVVQTIGAIIALLNPGTIVLTGDLISRGLLEEVKEKCAETIPAEYMPRFQLVDTLDEYYREGMYRLAVARKAF